MTERDERELRDDFQALRREDGAGSPPFAATLAAARARYAGPRRRRAVMFAAAIVLGSVALALLFTRRDRDGAGGVIDLAAVRWHAPTDFLLKVPGAELLRTVPRLGRVSLEGRIL